MDKEHVISEEATNEIQLALSKNEHWMAYSNSPYFLDREDMYFFKSQDEANQFANDNFSDYDSFRVLHFESLADVFRQIPYGESLAMYNRIDPDANPLHNKDGNAFTNESVEHIEQQQKISNNLKNTVMNDKNLGYLKDNIKYLGFGEKLYGDLEKNMKEGKPEFTLHIANAIQEETLRSSLHFRKSDTHDMYFLNKYDAVLNQPGKEERGQTFYLDKGKGISAREAYNLLDGRSVFKELTNKEGEKYHAWLKLDFENKDDRGNHKVQQFHTNYGYNLLDAVQNLPIRGMSKDKEEELVKYLQKGSISRVTVVGKEGDEITYIAANPQYKTLDMYDSEMKPLSKEQKEALQYQPDSVLHQKTGQTAEKMNGNGKSAEAKQNAGESKDNSAQKENQEQKQDSKIKGPKEEKSENKGAKKKVKQSEEDSLLPKKRHSTKKGLSV